MNELRNANVDRNNHKRGRLMVRRLCLEPLESRSMMAADFAGHWFQTFDIESDSSDRYGRYAEFDAWSVRGAARSEVGRFPSVSDGFFGRHEVRDAGSFFSSAAVYQGASRDFEFAPHPFASHGSEPSIHAFVIDLSVRPSNFPRVNPVHRGSSTSTRPAGEPPSGQSEVHKPTNAIQEVQSQTSHTPSNTPSLQSLWQSDLFISRGAPPSSESSRPQAPLSLEVTSQADGSLQERFLGASATESSNTVLAPIVSSTATGTVVEPSTSLSDPIDSESAIVPAMLTNAYEARIQPRERYLGTDAIFAENSEVESAWGQIHELLENLLQSRRDEVATRDAGRASMHRKQDVVNEQRSFELTADHGMIHLAVAPASLDSLLDVQQSSDAAEFPNIHGLVADMGIYHVMEFAGLTLNAAQAGTVPQRDADRTDSNLMMDEPAALGAAIPQSLTSRSFLLPELALFSGLFFWLKRRRRQHVAVNPGTTS